MEIHELPEKELEIIVLKVFRQLQGNTNNSTKIRKTIKEQNEKFNKETENSQTESQTESLELKNTITELKNSVQSSTSD